MALFQPTNIIPSSFTVGVVDAAKDIAQVSWQVNGNSAMTAFQIEFYEMDANDANKDVLVKSTEKVPVAGGFYGTDRFGKPQMYTWTENGGKTWNAYDPAFTNGKRFKLKITQFWREGGEEKSLPQIEVNVFETKALPQVVIYLSDSTYQGKENDAALVDGAKLATSIGYFRADYSQEQGDAVRNTRWQLATAIFSNNQWKTVEIISDTGEVPTPTLQFEFNGFFNEQSYAVRCLVESEGGQQANNPASQNDGWIFFSINIEAQGEYTGNFTVQCLPKENATLLQWTSEEIQPTVSGKYTLGNGYVTLEPHAVMQWSQEGGFSYPWTAVIELDLNATEAFQLIIPPQSSEVRRVFFARGFICSARVIGIDTYGRAECQIADDKKSCEVTITITNPQRFMSIMLSVVFDEVPFAPQGELAQIDMGSDKIVLRARLSEENGDYRLSCHNGNVRSADIDLSAVTSSKITLVFSHIGDFIVYDGGKKFGTDPISFTSKPIEKIQISGGDTGATFRCVTVYNTYFAYEVLDRMYSDPDFEPQRYVSDYKLHMTANFNGNIDGGELTKFRIYRQEVGKNDLTPIFYSENGNVLRLKDYGIVSRKSYTYWLYEYDKNDAYLKGAQCTLPSGGEAATISTCFTSYSLLVCDYDSTNDTYHVRKQYLFALNLSVGSEGNNNTPTLNANFTPYPTRMPSTQNYASGTLQGLIGAIYTVPALVEEIGGRLRTVKPSTMDYFDSVDLEKELKGLSVTPYTLFLRDMAGNLRMISTSNQIGMTPDLKKRQLPKTISFPWVEIGDASDVTLIQTPNDEGWDSGEQSLEIRLGTDPKTGILTANYPKPYEGTKFYLTGMKDETKRG